MKRYLGLCLLMVMFLGCEMRMERSVTSTPIKEDVKDTKLVEHVLFMYTSKNMTVDYIKEKLTEHSMSSKDIGVRSTFPHKRLFKITITHSLLSYIEVVEKLKEVLNSLEHQVIEIGSANR